MQVLVHALELVFPFPREGVMLQTPSASKENPSGSRCHPTPLPGVSESRSAPTVGRISESLKY